MQTTIRDNALAAAKALVQQGSFGSNGEGGCLYLTKEGTSCVVGLFLKNSYGADADDLNRLRCGVSAEASNVRQIMERTGAVLLSDDLRLLQAMQMIHDKASAFQEGFVPGDQVSDFRGAIKAAMLLYIERMEKEAEECPLDIPATHLAIELYTEALQ